MTVAVCGFILAGCCTVERSHGNWIYKVEDVNAYPTNVEKRINALTGEGWQFVSLSTTYNGPSSVPIATIVMKRAKP